MNAEMQRWRRRLEEDVERCLGKEGKWRKHGKQ